LESFFIHTYYYLISILLVSFLFVLIFAIYENRKVFAFIPEGTYYKLTGIVILGVLVRYAFASFFPNVFNDEFLYIATAENMARTGLSFPFLERSFPPYPWTNTSFLPPYPQLWPVLLSYIFRITGHYNYQVAGNLSVIISILIPIPAFFAGYFFFQSVGASKNMEHAAEVCGLFTALFWAALPTIIKLSGCASAEITSTFFIATFLALLFLYYRYPTPKTFLVMILGLSLVIHARPENLLYVLLLIPFFVRGKFRLLKYPRNLTIIILVFYILISLIIMTSGGADPDRNYVFQIKERENFDSKWANFMGNLQNNFLFLLGHNRVNPPIFTLLFLGGLLFLLWRGDDRFRGYLLLGWFLFFYFLFTPFPFGDYSNSFSSDAYRFSIHLYFPMIFAMSYCCFALWSKIK